jgi:hypothetical protein
VLPGTVWGTASGQNCQVPLGAVPNPQYWQQSARLPRHSRHRSSPAVSSHTANTGALPDQAAVGSHTSYAGHRSC